MLKLVTILFADVVSSTARAEKMYPDEVRALMTDFFDAMVEEIRAEGGRIEKFIGDAVMAVFGVPRAHEDDPVRAVRAGRRMLARLERWNLGREPLHQIQTRIGINTGDVLAAAPGSDLMVTGDAVNVAARLEQSAVTGSIVVGLRTARAVRPFFVLRELEPLVLKGKAEPVPAFEVADEREVVQDRRSYGFTASLVGRDQELAQLRASLEFVVEQRRPHLVTLEADPGVGKSRLTGEFASSVSGWTRVVTGRCLPYGEGVTLWPLGEVLRRESGILMSDPSEVAREKLEKVVDQVISPELVADRAPTVAALGATIAMEIGSSFYELDPRQRSREILGAWRALLAALASDAPLLVIVEDIHWADPMMLEALEYLVREVPSPVLFVCPTRPDFFVGRPEWGADSDRFSRVSLHPLESGATAELMTALLADADLPPAVRGSILKRSEGNPFFLEEMLNSLVDDGKLTMQDGRWVASPDIAEVEIPDTVQAVILARTDLLAGPTKKVIQNAAVVGRSFWDAPLRDLDIGAALEEALSDLEARGLVFGVPSSSIAGESEYIFKHILIRDVAYESLPRAARGKAHEATAAWMKRISTERVDELAELIAHHYHQAFDYTKKDEHREEARELYCTAATKACQRFAIQQAETYGWLAVDMSRAGGQRIETLEKLGDLYRVGYGMDAAWKVYRDALKETEESSSGDAAALRRLAAKAAIVPTRYEPTIRERPATEELQHVISTGIEATDVEDRDLAILLASKAIMQVFGYEPMDAQGEEAAKSAVEIAERIGDAEVLSCALDALSYWVSVEGLYGQVNQISRRRVDLLHQLTDLAEICDVHVVATWSSLYVGRYAEALEHADATIDLARDTEPGSYFQGLVMRVAARFMTGDWDGALADQAEIERLQAEDAGDLPPRHASFAYGFALFVRQLRGETETAAAYEVLLRRMDAEYQIIGRATTLAAVWARALAHRGEAQAARNLLHLERSSFLCGHLESLCDVIVAQQDWASAPAAIAAAREEAERAELLALPLYADRLEGAFCAAQGDQRRAVDLLRLSAEGFEQLSAPWEAALSRLALGESLVPEDPGAGYSELTMAAAAFRDLGSIRELQRAEELLASLP